MPRTKKEAPAPVATTSQAKRKKQPARDVQEGRAAVEDPPSNVKQDTAAKVDVNPKRRRTGEKAAAKKKLKVRQDEEDEDHQSVAGLREAVMNKAQQRSEVLVIPLPSGAAELLRARWLGHLKALAEVDVQVFSMAEVTASCQVDLPEAPRFLDVHSPNGQATCTGRYHLLPETINEQRIWKKDGHDRWIYSGIDGTWLVGGPKQKEQSFASRSCLLQQAVLHKGEMPDKLPGGRWKRVDGKTWKEDSDILVTGPGQPLLAGQPVQVTGMNEKNGLGRLISRRQEKGNNIWQVQLADGEEEVPEKNLELREIQQDEVWLAADTSKLRKASDMCEVLLATLLGDVVKSAISGEYPFRLPRVVQDMPVDDLCDLMERFNVILGFQKDDSENGELHRIHRLRLVIFGIKSTSAVMRLLEHIEELHPGCLGSLNPDSLELCDSHFGVSITKALVTMEKDWLQRLARLMQVEATQVGSVSILLGGRNERERSSELIQMAHGSSEVVPEILKPCCASIRVPQQAAEVIGKEMQALSEELDLIPVWCVQAESGIEEVEEDRTQVFLPGAPVHAVHEDGDWYDATIVDVDGSKQKVDVQWSDGTSSKILAKDLKVKHTADFQSRQRREGWLRTARRLVIFGSPRGRKIATARVLVAVEEQCRGIWTLDLLETVEELRGSVGEDTSIDVKLFPFFGGPSPSLYMLKTTKGLKESLQRAASASGSYMCLLGHAALLVVGSHQERSQGLDYLELIAADKLVWQTFSNGSSLEDEVSWSDEDQFLLVMGDKCSLDFSMNDIYKVRDVEVVSYSDSTLNLTGHGKVWRVRTSEEVVKRVFQLFLRSRLLNVLHSSDSRGDTMVIETTFGQAVWLEPVELRVVEKKTKTIVIVPQIDRSASNWEPDARCKILVCGSELCRAEAAKELAKILQPENEVPKDEELELVELEPAPPAPPAPAAPRTPAPPPKAAKVKAPPAGAVMCKEDVVLQRPRGPSNPLEELRILGFWPKDNHSWSTLQDKIWRGHPPLRPGWIRVWSRSKDREFYVDLSSGETTFDFATAAG